MGVSCIISCAYELCVGAAKTSSCSTLHVLL